MNWILDFTMPAATETEIVGGKGANLAILSQRGFPVPDGFVVTAQAYRQFILTTGKLLAQVEQFSFDDPFALVGQAAELRSELERHPLPGPLVEAVIGGVRRFSPDTAFSVRSSSTFEDLASAAFAGQHDTFLNIAGIEAILDRIRACFASLWQDRAISYRQKQGFSHRTATMAVVVQRMIRCDVAGVGFTINPVSGALDEMLINANYGLGESVVSGEGEIDQYVLNKDGQLKSSVIGCKTSQVRCAEHGAEGITIPFAQAMQACLSEEQLAELSSLMLRVEDSYQFPQDIEWGFDAGGLHLLQSRPVTSLPPRWTRDEAAERFPNVITPLAWDMVEEGFHRSLNHSFNLMGYPAFPGKWFGMHDHYIYGNQNAVELYGSRAPFKLTSLGELEAMLPVLRERFSWVQSLPMEWSRNLDRYLLGIGEFMAEPLADKDLNGVWDFILRVNRLGSDYFLPNIAISLTQRMLYKVLLGMLSMLSGGTEAGARLFDDLMAHCETKTGIINKELYEMARETRDTPGLSKLLEGVSRDIIAKGSLQSFPQFAVRFQTFLADHGHRETDFDPYHPTWVEAPWVVLDNLRLMASAPAAAEPEQREQSLRMKQLDAEIALFAKLPGPLHFFFHELLRLARVYTTLDDVEHYQTTRLTLPMRKGLRELGHRLMRRDIIAEPMDVFFCRFRDLGEAIDHDDPDLWDKLAEAVRREKAAYLSHRSVPPIWNLGDEKAPITASEGQLSGLAGSPGVAEGQAYLVLSPDDFAGFPEGAVLVARTTNPAWTPLFYSACAVVTESGGPLSHGAVTAREMGIPAVMSVHGILTRVSNGLRLQVDGSTGRVNVL